MRDLSLHTFLTWLYIAAAILLGFYCLLLLSAAAHIRRSTRLAKHPRVEVFSPTDLPPRARPLFDQMHGVLTSLRFAYAAGVRSVLIEGRLFDFHFLYILRQAGTRAAAAIRLDEGTLHTAIAFVTEYAGGPVVRTATQGGAGAGGALAVTLNADTPPATACGLHDQRVAELCPGRADWVLPREGSEAGFFLARVSDRLAEYLATASVDRNWESDRTGNYYIPTWRFAIRHSTRYVWPFCAFVRRDSGRGFDVLPARM